jgi:DNA-binding transcriptional regulator YdaS (Cro superfamily)
MVLTVNNGVKSRPKIEPTPVPTMNRSASPETSCFEALPAVDRPRLAVSAAADDVRSWLADTASPVTFVDRIGEFDSVAGQQF